jgi:hypothetical protein
MPQIRACTSNALLAQRILLLKSAQSLTRLDREVNIGDRTYNFLEGVERLFIAQNG